MPTKVLRRIEYEREGWANEGLHSGNYFRQRENVDGVIKSRNFFSNYLAQFYYLIILFLSVCHHLSFLYSF